MTESLGRLPLVDERVVDHIIRLHSPVPNRPLTTTLADVRPCNVGGNAIEPVLERAFSAESAQSAESPEERLLRYVLGIGIVGRHGAGRS